MDAAILLLAAALGIVAGLALLVAGAVIKVWRRLEALERALVDLASVMPSRDEMRYYNTGPRDV